MSNKIFMEKGSDGMCYPLSYWKENVFEFEREYILEEMKVEYGNGLFFCTVNETCGDVGDMYNSCGNDCADYEPRNGKSGRCRHSKNTYGPTGKVFRLTKGKKLIEIK